MSLFESLVLFALVIIVCAVCLCAHYLQLLVGRNGGVSSSLAKTASSVGYAKK